MKQFTPMLASAPGPAGVRVFPLLATPKIDGIRAVVLKGSLVSRTLKSIPNTALRKALESVLPEGTDGEVTHGESFQTSTSAIMSKQGPLSGYVYHAFDYIGPTVDISTPYSQRITELSRLMNTPSRKILLRAVEHMVQVNILMPTSIKDIAALDAFESKMLVKGFEGLIVRKPDGGYKFGRSTPNEGLMLKIKRFEDAEATVVGVEELIHKETDISGMLGSLVSVRLDGVTFKIGSGFTMVQRKEMWERRHEIIGKQVKYRFFKIGSGLKAAPRFPTFIGFRDINDM